MLEEFLRQLRNMQAIDCRQTAQYKFLNRLSDNLFKTSIPERLIPCVLVTMKVELFGIDTADIYALADEYAPLVCKTFDLLEALGVETDEDFRQWFISNPLTISYK